MGRIRNIVVKKEAFTNLGLGQPDQVYAIITASGDCMINGWLDVTGIECDKLVKNKIKLEAALIHRDGGGIIDRAVSFKSVNQAVELGYSAFTIFISGVSRHCELDDIDHVMLYPVFDD